MMTCYHPITAWRSRAGRSKNGSWPLVFTKSDGFIDMEVQLPCGGCIGCRLENSRQWALRCVAEAEGYYDNCFITLTYDNDHLPKDESLSKCEVQKFMKRLRKEYGNGIRYFLCGEYGENFARPHYHLCMFNFDPADKIEILYDGPKSPLSTYAESHQSNKLYTSNSVEKLWGNGFITVGNLTFESAAYVARYVTKKVKGEGSEEFYEGRQPEFALMSRKPGIGAEWFRKYKQDVLSIDGIALRNGLTFPSPKYYDNVIKNSDPDKYKKIKERRKKRCKDYTPERLREKELYKYYQQKQKLRKLEK